MKDHFQMFAAYNGWANAAVYEAARGLSADEWTSNRGAFFGSMMGTLNHLLAADRIWMRRLTGTGEAPTALNTIIHPEFDLLQQARITEDRRIAEWIEA